MLVSKTTSIVCTSYAVYPRPTNTGKTGMEKGNITDIDGFDPIGATEKGIAYGMPGTARVMEAGMIYQVLNRGSGRRGFLMGPA